MQQDAHGQHMSGIFIHQLRTLPIHKAEGEGKKVPKLLSEIGQVDEQCDQQPERSRLKATSLPEDASCASLAVVHHSQATPDRLGKSTGLPSPTGMARLAVSVAVLLWCALG